VNAAKRPLLLPRLAALAALLGMLAWFALSGGFGAALPALVTWLRGSGLRGALVYGLLFIPTALLMLPSSPLMLGAGYLFGFGPGLLLGAPAAALAASITLLVARTLGRPLALVLSRRLPRFEALAKAVDRHWFEVIALLRTTPLVPFPVFTWALGLTRLGPARFFLASLAGMAPANLVYCWLGSRATQVAALLQSPSQLLGARALGLTAGLLCFTALVLWLAGRRLALALAEAERETAAGAAEV
jgi:uncharacterized membrane protein YdjX (TVP38/TMEM64 family)